MLSEQVIPVRTVDPSGPVSGDGEASLRQPQAAVVDQVHHVLNRHDRFTVA